MPRRTCFVIVCSLLLTLPASAQSIYGLFGLPSPDIGKRQIGTLDPTDGAVSLIGSSSSIDSDTIGTFAGITGIAVAGEVFYFIGTDNGSGLSTVYTVDVGSGATVTAAPLSAYSAAEVSGLWYDEGSSTLWGLFIDSGDRALATIDPATGTVGTPINGAITGGNVSTAPGVFTGDSAGQRVFFIGTADSLGEPYVFEVSTADGTVTPYISEDYSESVIQGMEWDSINSILWMIVHLPGGGRQLASYDLEEQFVQTASEEIDFSAPIATTQGLIALDDDSAQLFFIGRPDGGSWSVYTVSVPSGATTWQTISGAIQINGWAGFEIIPGPDLSLTKDDGGATVTPGQTITYTLTAANAAGAGAATGVVLSETVPAETTFNAAASTAGWVCSGTGAAGDTCTLDTADIPSNSNQVSTFAVTVDASVSAGVTTISNTASLDAANTTATAQDSDTTPVTASPTLGLSKDDGISSTTPGSLVTYTLGISNSGNEDAASVQLTDTVPANAIFVPGSSTAGWSCVPDVNPGSVCTLAIGTVAGGSSTSAAFAVQVAASMPAGVSQLSNNAELSAANASSTQANHVTPVTAAPSLALAKSDGGTSTEPGLVVSYTLDYSNTGDQDTANAILTETVPDQTTFNAAASDPLWSCVPDTSAGSSCTLAVGTVSGGDSGAAVFSVMVDDPVLAGTTTISNTAGFDADNAAATQAADTTPVTAAVDLDLTKSDGDTGAIPGQRVPYVLVYENLGNENAVEVVLTETVPDHSTFAADGSSPGWDCQPDGNAGSTCTYEIGDLAGHDWGLAFFAVDVVNPVSLGVTEISNTASVDAGNAPSSAEASDTTPVSTLLDLAVSKDDGGIVARPGGTVDYTIGWSNPGNQNASGVVLTETVPDLTSFDPSGSDARWSCAPDPGAGSTCTLTVASLAAGESGSALFSVQVDDPLSAPAPTLENSVSITDDGALGSDEVPGNDTASTSTPTDVLPPTVVSIDAAPSVGGIDPCDQLAAAVDTVVVELADDSTGVADPDHMASYILLSTGPDADFDTLACGPVYGDDVEIPLTSVISSGPATGPTVTLTASASLKNGVHQLLICDTLVDGAGNALDGDGDGSAGGDFARRFRVDIDNLFANSNLDDCPEAPISLPPWQLDSMGSAAITVTTSVDLDDSSLSGAIHVTSLDGEVTLVSQCVPLGTQPAYLAEAAVSGSPDQLDDLEVNLICAFSTAADCSALQPFSVYGSATIVPSPTPGWKLIRAEGMTSQAGDAAILCGIEVFSQNSDPNQIFVDDLFLEELLFSDGFESGDTSRWSFAVQ